MKRPPVILFLALNLLSCLTAMGQSIPMRSFGVEDGLYNADVYDCQTDSRDQLWIATRRGVLRYDGQSFTDYQYRPEFNGVGVFHIHKSANGRLYFMSLGGYCVVYDPVTDSLAKLSTLAEYRNHCYWVEDGPDGNMWFGEFCGELLELKEDSVVRRIGLHPESQKVTTMVRHLGGALVKSGFYFYHVSDSGEVQRLPWPRTTEYCRFLRLRDGRLLMATKKGIHLVEGLIHQLIIPFSERFAGREILRFAEEKDGSIWVCTMNGAYCFDSSLANPMPLLSLLEGKLVSGATQDFEGNLWFSTLGSGLYQLISKQARLIVEPNSDLRPICAAHKGDSTFVLMSDGDLSILDNSENHKVLGKARYASQSMVSSPRNWLFVDTENNIWLAYGPNIYRGKPHEFWHHTENMYPNEETIHVLAQAPNGRAWLYAGRWVAEYNKGALKKYCEFRQGSKRSRMGCRDLLVRRNGEVLVLSIDHYPFKIDTVKKSPEYLISKRSSPLNGKTQALLEDPKRRVWAMVSGQPLVEISGDSVIRRISQDDGLLGNRPYLMHIDKQGAIWLAYEKGLNKIKVDEGPSILSYGSGLLSKGMPIGLSDHRGLLYVVTEAGLVCFPLDAGENLPAPKIYLDNWLRQGPDSLRARQQMNISYSEKPLFFSYRGISYRSRADLSYAYRIKGLDSSWNYTSNSSFSTANLSPGGYVLEVKARNIEGTWSTEPAQLAFNITPRYWQAWWFLALGLLVGLAALYLLFRLRLRAVRKRGKLEKRAIESELKALRTQMNPHFIFNSIHSIQDFIMDLDPLPANQYLTKFAALMRHIVDFSDKAFITLSEEQEFLMLYLDLEQLRFKNAFALKLELDPELDAELIDIPPLLVQPLVENAIKHGLSGLRERQPTLLIRFYLKEDELFCCVEDNGLGRGAASRSSHRSVGLQNIKERLQLLFGWRSDLLVIEDLLDEQGQPAGTRIRLLLSTSG